MFIDFMFNSQGEDIVSGRHTLRNTQKLRQIMPRVHKEIQNIKSRLEIEFKDMQDFSQVRVSIAMVSHWPEKC